MRLGILGGTFNPPHIGHLICAQEASLQLGLDRVLLIPASVPPHKAVEEEPGTDHRLGLCHAAVDGDPRFEISQLEMERSGPSYTVDTLEELNTRAPHSDLFFILGADAAARLPDWHEPERVLSLATLAVARRRGTSRSEVRRAMEDIGGADRAQYFKMPRIAISSSMIRSRVRAGEPITYLVPAAVERYIAQHGLYAGQGAPA